MEETESHEPQPILHQYKVRYISELLLDISPAQLNCDQFDDCSKSNEVS